jgi:tetratricopeptide (TPR) repeat protein
MEATRMDRIAQLEKLLAAEPGDTFVLYSLGQEHAKAGQHEQAIGFYERCIESEPGEHYAYFHMARSLEAMGEEGRAVEVLSAGLARARADGNMKASSELDAYRGQLA